MYGLEHDTVQGFNDLLAQQRQESGEALVTTVLFDDHSTLLHDRADIRTVPPLTAEDYLPRGNTALLDALGAAMHRIRAAQRDTPEEDRPEKTLFVILTDGEENASRHYSYDMIRKRIEHQRKKHGWEFVFFGANMDAAAEAEKIGIRADRAQNYLSSSSGTRSAWSAVSAVSSVFRSGDTLSSMSVRQVRFDSPESLEGLMRRAHSSAAQAPSEVMEDTMGPARPAGDRGRESDSESGTEGGERE